MQKLSRLVLMDLAWIWIVTFVTAASSTSNDTISVEDQFCNKYGNDVNTSGVWQPLHRTKNTQPLLLTSVCKQAHRLAKLGPPSVNVFCFYTRTLKFKSDKYQPINIDLVIYSVTLPNSTRIDPRCWVITKGLRSDCVYYLEKLGPAVDQFYLMDQHLEVIRYTLVRQELTYKFSVVIQDMNIYAVAFGRLDDPEIAGVWEIERNMCEDVPRMKNVARQEHYRMCFRQPLVTNITLAKSVPHIDPSLNYEPMTIEFIAHTTDEEIVDGREDRPQLWHDCLYYLESRDAGVENLSLRWQVCTTNLKPL